MTVRLGTRVPDTTVNLGAAILSGGGSPPAPAATMPSTALYLPGISGNYVSTPDDASLDITGDLCLVAHVALNDWTPTVASESTLLGKWNSANQRSFRFDVEAVTGYLMFWGSATGTSPFVNPKSTVAPTISDGNDLWVALTVDVDNGASGHDVKFWTSSDGSTWSQLGSTVTTAGTTSFFNSTQALEIGSYNNGAAGLKPGTVYYAAVYDGIGANTAPGQGTLVYEADFSHPWVGNRYTDSTGKVSTINGSAWAWEVV